MAFLRSSLPPLLIALSVGMAHAQQQKSTFFDTTGGTTEEDVAKFGGVGADEALDQKTKEIIDRFKSGRKSSNSDQSSRYSKILEHHDEDFDGITDHDGASNALEGGMEKAALKGQKLSGDKRQEALEKARINAGRCKDGKVGEDGICRNISADIVDRGAAHGKEDDDHRVYELTDEALKAAKDAGQKYAEKAISMAGDYGKAPPPPNAQAIKSEDGTINAMMVKSGNYNTKVNLAPNIDLLKSEASYLEQLKDFQTKLQWKSMRAARLAGQEGDSETIRQMASILEKGPDDEQNLQEVAKRIEEIQTIGEWPACADGTEPNEQSGKCPDGKFPDMDLNDLSAQQTNQSRAAAAKLRQIYRQKASKGQSPAGAKSQKKDLAQIRKCLDRDVWCPGPEGVARVAAQQKRSNPNAKKDTRAEYTPVNGDPGGTYTDTREYLMNRLDAANSGGLDNFMNVMKSADFNAQTDGKTQNQPFAKMKEEWETAKRAADVVQGKAKDPVRDRAFQNSRYRKNNPYQGQMFNTQNMNTAQLFGRNARRDGGMLLTSPMPTGQAQGPISGGYGPAPRDPASGPPSSDRGGSTNSMPAPIPFNNGY